jgi:COMPASS component SPP1
MNPEAIKLYCLCRSPENGENMIGCDKCDEWFHFNCVGIDAVKFV